MAISVTTASQALANYQAGVQNPNAQTKWAQKLAPNGAAIFAAAAAASTIWQQAVSSPAALAKFKTNVAAADPTMFATVVNGQGKINWSQNSITKAPRMGTALTKIIPAIVNILPTLPPKGPKGTNTARATAFGTAMHQLAGKLGSGK